MIALKNIKEVLTLENAFNKKGKNLKPEDTCLKKNCSVIADSKVRFVGTFEDAPSELKDRIKKEIDLSDCVLTPELVDNHTHLIFGGNRSKEYSMRLNGADYQEIANAGGGILESSRGTNSCTDEELLSICSERIDRISSYGVKTIEIKSGYGLGYKEELRLSKLIDKLKKNFQPKIQIKNTYMAAHAVPKSSADSHQYLKDVCLPLLKELASEKIIDFVDIFHEQGYFDETDVRDLFREASTLGIPCRSHIDEFNDNHGAELAVSLNAVSVEHLLNTNDQGVKALSESETVATFLPGTGFFLGKKQVNARKFLDAGVRVAIGSDYNPGSCHCDNLLLISSLAAPIYKMNMAELWASMTLNPAFSLGLKNQGAIAVGLDARFSVFNTNSIDEITYNWGRNFYKDIDFTF